MPHAQKSEAGRYLFTFPRYIFEKLMMRDEPRRKDERAAISVFIASQFQLVPTVGITPPPPYNFWRIYFYFYFFFWGSSRRWSF